MLRGTVGAVVLGTAGSAEGALAAEPSGAPYGLLCDLLAFPERVKLTDSAPAFSWIVGDTASNAVQTGYQIQVASRQDALEAGRGDLWDSGRVKSDQSAGVRYAGVALKANSDIFWRVRTWDRQGKPSVYSASQRVVIGELASPPATVRYPIVTTPISPVRIVSKGAGHYFVDFGKAAFGRLSISLPAGSAESKVTLLLGEAKLADETVNPKPGGSIRFLKAETALTATAQLVPPPAQKQLPFRYVEVLDYPGTLTPALISQIAEHYPFDEKASDFHSSDNTLNDVWELCKYSIKATSFLGVYIDGDRERKPYEADAYINQLGHYSVDREYALARYTFEYLLAHPTWPTEWQPHMVFIAWADYLYTGDDAPLRNHYDALKARTLIGLAREDGLISTKTGLVTPAFLTSLNLNRMEDIVDWPLGERDGYKFGPVNTVVNAFHYRALQRMASIATALKRPDEATMFRDRAAKVYSAFNIHLFDPAQGLYRDAEDNDHASLHGNLFALAFGLVSADRQKKVVAFIKSRGMACSVYAAQYLLEALYAAGEAQYALELLTAKTGRSWGHMLYEVGTTITLEAWDNKYKPNQDWNHAWGAAPANIIPNYLMGIRPVEPGWKRMRIAPQPGRLGRAEMTVPTVRGPVSVAFVQEANSFECDVTLPANTVADIVLPVPGNPGGKVRLLIDGRSRNIDTSNGVCELADIGAGKHRFELRVS